MNKTSMPLSKQEFRRRLVAGLSLYGMELTDLPTLLEEFDDVPKHHAARMGRESDELGPGSGTALAVTTALGLPREWLEAEDWTSLIPGSELRDRALEIGEARRAANAAARAKQIAHRKSPGKRSSKAKPGEAE
jgi:hypothetical protein